MQRGFIQIPLLIAIVVALLGGGAFVAYEVAKPAQNASPKIVVEGDAQATVDATTTEQVREEGGVADENDSVIDSLKKQVEDLTQKASAPKTETQNTTAAPKTTTVTLPSGAIVEMDANGNVIRTIWEAPQQNYAQPTSTPNPAPIPNPTPAPAITPSYSDFILKYEQDPNYGGISCGGQIKIQLIKNSDRDIRIKKIVVNASNMTSDQTVGIKYTGAPLTLQQIDASRWEWNKEFSVKPGVQLIELYPSGSCGLNVTLSPIFNEWQIWDYTSNKPVKMEPNY